MSNLSAKQKNDTSFNGFNAARILASVAIVWCHTPRSQALSAAEPIGVFGTAFFAAAAMFFMARSLHREPGRDFSTYARKRVVRLGAPFLVWTAFYLVFRDVCRVFISHETAVTLHPSMLLVGSEMQLWFLPFLLMSSLLLFPLVKFATRSAIHRRWTAWVMASIGLVLALLPVPHLYGADEVRRFQTCVWYVLPCVFWGLTVALNYDWLSQHILRQRWTTAAGVAMTLTSIYVIWHGGNCVWGKNLGGLGWLIVSLSMPINRVGNVLAKLAPLGFGIYLTHPFFQGIFRAVSQKVHVGPTAANDIMLFAFTISGALGLSWLLRQNQRTAWLIA